MTPYTTLELPVSRTNFHGPKGVRATEVRLYLQLLIGAFSLRLHVSHMRKQQLSRVNQDVHRNAPVINNNNNNITKNENDKSIFVSSEKVS